MDGLAGEHHPRGQGCGLRRIAEGRAGGRRICRGRCAGGSRDAGAEKAPDRLRGLPAGADVLFHGAHDVELADPVFL